MRQVKQANYSSRTADKFVVRLPDGMRERVAELARENHRSMNAEIVSRLETSLNTSEVDTPSLNGVGDATALISKLDVQAWSPRIGDLVRRRDNKRIVGSIAKFETSHLGLMAVCDQLEGGVIRQAVGILESVDITQVIEESGGPVHKALERIAEGV